jgi:hypothetical protein
MNKPRIRVYTKSIELINIENNNEVFKHKDLFYKWLSSDNHDKTCNPEFSQINYLRLV